MDEPVSRYYVSQGLKLHWSDWGNEGAPPLLLVHGGLDHGRSWDAIAKGLRNDYRVMALDLRGHGDSEWVRGSSYPLPDYVADIYEFLQQQKIEKVRIVSHSMGGGISLLLAGSFPELVERLFVIEGLRVMLPNTDPIQDRMTRWIGQIQDQSRRQPRGYASIEDALARMQAAHPRLTEQQARHLTTHGVRQRPDGTWFWKYDGGIRLRSPYRLSFEDVSQLWSRIACPTLLVRGAASGRPDPAEKGWMQYFQHGSIHDVDGAGHWVHHDNPDGILELARNFLRE